MKKQIILLVVLLFALSGCTAEYNLTINEKEITENISIHFSKEQYDEDEIAPYASSNIPITQEIDQIKFYESEETEDNDNYNLNYNYSFPIDKFSKSYFATRCYNDVYLTEEDGILKLSTGSEFSCINIQDLNQKVDSVQVNITTNLKVLKSNADKVSGNTYTWIINNQNYTNKPIQMNIRVKELTTDEKISKMLNVIPNIEIIIISIVLIIIAIILYFFIKRKENNNNQF